MPDRGPGRRRTRRPFDLIAAAVGAVLILLGLTAVHGALAWLVIVFGALTLLWNLLRYFGVTGRQKARVLR